MASDRISSFSFAGMALFPLELTRYLAVLVVVVVCLNGASVNVVRDSLSNSFPLSSSLNVLWSLRTSFLGQYGGFDGLVETVFDVVARCLLATTGTVGLSCCSGCGWCSVLPYWISIASIISDVLLFGRWNSSRIARSSSGTTFISRESVEAAR